MRHATKFAAVLLVAACVSAPVARAEWMVQRGTATLANTGVTNLFVTLEQPVPVGKSFVIASTRCNLTGYDGGMRSMVTAQLTNVVAGAYTQLRFNRRGTGDRLAYVEWQVLSGDEFTVQTGAMTVPNDYSYVTVLQAISPIDMNRAFLFFTVNTEHAAEWRRCMFRGRITSSTQIEFYRYAPSVQDIVWYVVEWQGARVQSGILSMTNSTQAAVILSRPAPQSKSFMYFSYAYPAHNGIADNNLFVHGSFLSENELEFRTGVTTTNFIAYFVVEHDDISVQSGGCTLAAGETAATNVVFAQSLDKAFVPVGQFGNGWSDWATGDPGAQDNGMHTQQLEPRDERYKANLAVRRMGTLGSLNASWFVVTKRLPQGTIFSIQGR